MSCSQIRLRSNLTGPRWFSLLRVATVGWVFLLAMSTALPSHAHSVGLSTVEVTLLEGARIEVQIGLAPKEVAQAFSTLDPNKTQTIEPGELVVETAALALRGGIDLLVGTQRCEVNMTEATLAAGDAVVFKLKGTCPSGRLERVGLPWLAAVGPKHRAVVRVLEGPKPVGEAMLSMDQRAAPLDVFVQGNSSWSFLPIGVEHILIGIDHLLFLFGLVLLRARRREIFAIVTAFTIAHSLTLSAAILGWMNLGATFVESMIALSVAFVGFENLLGPDMSKRWRLTFFFGLVHGFGFAGVLSEIGLPQESKFSALLLFNVGVEVGQLLVLAFVLPLLVLARQWRSYESRAVPALNGLLIVIGLLWFIERVS